MTVISVGRTAGFLQLPVVTPLVTGSNPGLTWLYVMGTQTCVQSAIYKCHSP